MDRLERKTLMPPTSTIFNRRSDQMNHTIVKIYFISGGHTMASYIHPISDKAIRKKFDSKDEALEYKKEIESKYSGKNLDRSSDITISDVIYILLNKYSASYIIKGKRRLEDFCNTFGTLSPKEISTEMLKFWLTQIKKEGDYSHNTMVAVKFQINTIFRFLLQEKLIDKNPLEPLKTTRIPPFKRKRIHLSPSQIEILLSSAKQLSPGYLFPIILTFVEIAVKTTELIDLQWNDVNFNKNTINIKKNRSLQERTITMSPLLAKTFKEKKVFAEYIFTDSNHEQLNKNKLLRSIKEFKKKSDIDFEWSCLDLRHSYGYNFLTSTSDLQKLSYQLGHYRIHETKVRYMNPTQTTPEIAPLY